MMPKPSLPGILGIGDKGFGYWGSGFGHRVRTLMPKTGARVEKLVGFREFQRLAVQGLRFKGLVRY